MTSIGIELGGINYYSTEEPFLDRFKTSDTWRAIDSNWQSVSVTLDANGYPVGMPAGGFQLSTIFGVDPYDAGTGHRYVLSYDGSATMLFAGANVVGGTPGHLILEVPPTSNGMVLMAIQNMDPAHPVNNIHVVREDQVALFNSGEIFNPDFLHKMSNFDMLRFMDWQNTNNNLSAAWNDRADAADASWGHDANAGGVPLDVMVKLSNQTRTDMWYNVPGQADDTYVRNALTYIRDHLDPALKVHIEYSNEVWNTMFPIANYAQTKANQLWGVDANHNGTIDPSEAVQGGNEVFYGYRSAQVANIAHQVFSGAASGRVETVLAGQEGYPALTSGYAVPGVALAHVGTVSSLFSEYAVAPYFGGQFNGWNAADAAKVLGWARGGDAGLTAALHELQFGGALSSDNSLAAVARGDLASGGFADTYGLDLVAYEGGASLVAYTFGADAPEITAFFAKMLKDPRIGGIYTQMIADFKAAGGTLFNAFADVGTASPFGYWGVLDSIYDSGSARYDALVNASADSRSAIAAASAGGTAAAIAAGFPTTSALPYSPVVYGTAGNDVLAIGTSGGTLEGQAGNDTLYAGAASDLINGGDGNDVIIGSSGSINGAGQYSEADFYCGGAGSDTITGGQGNDHIYGNSLTTPMGAVDGADSLSGGGGNDYVQGNAGNDTIDGGAGNDRLYGGSDNDSILGGTGNDYLQGNRGVDTLRGGDGADTLRGGADNDILYGDADKDQLFGDAGNDTLIGGAGADTMTGGAGIDLFSFGRSDALITSGASNTYSLDEIIDFSHGTDHIGLGFSVHSLFAGTASSLANAMTYANTVLQAHPGEADVAAVAVGSDTYLFYNAGGAGGAADSAIKLDGVTASTLTIAADFV